MKTALCVLLVAFVARAYPINRFLKVDGGLKLAGMAVDVSDKNPRNYARLRFDFAAGFTSDVWIASRTALGFDFLYQRKGAHIAGEPFVLHYLSLPVFFKFYVDRDFSTSLILGLVHNFLVGVQGRLLYPNVSVTYKDMNVYDFGFTFGMQYVFHRFSNDFELFGEIRMEFDWINAYKQYSPRLWNRVYCYLAVGLHMF